MKRRLGTFKIQIGIVKDNEILAREILKDVIVVKAELMFVTDTVDYVGMHPSFKEIESACPALEYDTVIELGEDNCDNFVGFKLRV